MSKYNLIDIFEQYQIGSGFTRDFDYAGMLNAGLKTGVDTDIEILRKMSDDFEDVNYHRENNHLQKAIDALEEGAIKEASMFFGDFHAEIKSTMETFDMDIEPTLGKFMASKMEEGEAVDLAIEASQEKAGIKEDKYDDIVDADNDIPADKKKAAAAAYRKVDKGASYKKATSHIKENEDMYDVVDKASGEMIDDDLPKRMALALAAKKKGWVTKKSQKKKMNEVRIDRDVADKIEGMLSRPLKAQFLDAFDDLWEDLTEDDMFYPEDVINHLHNEMHKRLRLYRTPDFKQEEFTAIPEGDAVNFDMKADTDYDEGLEDIEESLPKKPSIIRALKVDGNGTKMEIDSYMASLKRSGDEFDDVDDYVEDFKNYIDDKALQEHFKRFM